MIACSLHADGNLTSDGRWDYTWDADNRLIKMPRKIYGASAGAPNWTLEFNYDSRGRRIEKKLTNSGYPQYTDTFGYDGLTASPLPAVETMRSVTAEPGSLGINLMARLHGGSLHQSYAWGLYLSGGLQEAGGVGGLLSRVSSKCTTRGRFKVYHPRERWS